MSNRLSWVLRGEGYTNYGYGITEPISDAIESTKGFELLEECACGSGLIEKDVFIEALFQLKKTRPEIQGNVAPDFLYWWSKNAIERLMGWDSQYLFIQASTGCKHEPENVRSKYCFKRPFPGAKLLPAIAQHFAYRSLPANVSSFIPKGADLIRMTLQEFAGELDLCRPDGELFYEIRGVLLEGIGKSAIKAELDLISCTMTNNDEKIGKLYLFPDASDPKRLIPASEGVVDISECYNSWHFYQAIQDLGSCTVISIGDYIYLYI